MDYNLAGRVKRIQLTHSQALSPIFEAVSNSIHAIQDAARAGAITVQLRRAPGETSLLPGSESTAPIETVTITDNGIGFTEAHLTAFLEADTLFRITKGGKGVGRLTWLKVFKSVSVESSYRGSAGFHRRTFEFALPDGLKREDVRDDPVSDAKAASGTTITLREPYGEYVEPLRRTISAIASALARHFLPVLLSPAPPTIVVRDSTDIATVEADDIAERVTGAFEIKGKRFTVHHLKIRSPSYRHNMAYFCAAERQVLGERLQYLPDHAFHGENGAYYYHAYVFSEFLDTRANEVRTGFHIDDAPGLGEPGFGEIRDALRQHVSEHLTIELSTLAESRTARIDRVLTQRLPDLDYLRDMNREDLLNIPLDATEAQVADTLGALHLKNQATSRQLLSSMISDLRDSATLDLDSFQRQFDERIQDISRPSQANLAGYVLYRRSIINLYREILKKSGNAFEREAAVHKLLFPMGTDLSKGGPPINHNLWMLDERLTYADYIASDRPLDQHRVLFESNSRAEPDVACYFNFGFSEDDPTTGALKTVVLVELKRPGPLRGKKENPWEQVMRYISQMKDGAWSAGGQKIKASNDTRFYCFVVCDLDGATVREMIEHYQFKGVFDGAEGWFLYNEPLRAYVELIPFEKVLRDAERKHRAFFERLGLLRG